MIRLVDLYPRTWRSRYEDEFLALLADRPPDLADRLDIVRGAIDARVHPPVEPAPLPVEPPIARGPWPVRAGWLTLAGGGLWFVALIVAVSGPIVVGEKGSYRDAGAALPIVFTAVMLLGVGLLALVLELPEPSHRARVVAAVSCLAGLVWAFAPWMMWFGLVAFGGLLIVGFAAWRAGTWSLAALTALVVGVTIPWATILAVASGAVAANPNPDIQFLVLGLLGTAWAVVGISLVRSPSATRPIADAQTE
jgi:hypothetical protein